MPVNTNKFMNHTVVKHFQQLIVDAYQAMPRTEQRNQKYTIYYQKFDADQWEHTIIEYLNKWSLILTPEQATNWEHAIETFNTEKLVHLFQEIVYNYDTKYWGVIIKSKLNDEWDEGMKTSYAPLQQYINEVLHYEHVLMGIWQ